MKEQFLISFVRAVDFVMSKIDRLVGMRAESNNVPISAALLLEL